jgi:nicotinamide-nucleotide amidase
VADHQAILELSSSLVADLALAGKTVATAESCSGGWIAKAITDVAGSSRVFGYGIVSYSNSAKETLLGVNGATLDVSAAVVEEMASGVIELSGADIAVAVSGVAGPDGGSEDKPVGTVWFAWAVRQGKELRISSECRHFGGDRDEVRALTVSCALQGVRERIS